MWSRLDPGAFDLVVVSPRAGPAGLAARRSASALDVLRRSDVPVLGVCLGHQALAYASARGWCSRRPRGTATSSACGTSAGDLFAGMPQGFTAVRYHSWCVAEPVPEDVEVTAYAEDGG
jgi:para-aminobenzoate synthetase